MPNPKICNQIADPAARRRCLEYKGEFAEQGGPQGGRQAGRPGGGMGGPRGRGGLGMPRNLRGRGRRGY